MTDPYRIIVGHDLDKTGDEAIEQAYALASRITEPEIHVVHALSMRGKFDVVASSKKLDDAMVELRARVTPIARRFTPTVPTHMHVRLGTVLEVIQQIAVDYDASLVLVGTHGYRGIEGLSHRSIAAKLVRIARLPVLVAHAKDFSGLTATPRPDAARPGQDLHRARTSAELLITHDRTSHVSGLF